MLWASDISGLWKTLMTKQAFKAVLETAKNLNGTYTAKNYQSRRAQAIHLKKPA